MYTDCCGLYISHTKIPETAEQLMRSRFSAFKLKKYDYLIETCQPQKQESPLNVSDFDPDIDWLGLRIISKNLGGHNDKEGFVEFVAFYRESISANNPKFHQLHERSYFKKIEGIWSYISGIPLFGVKLTRNDPCFCNSGKKYKKCHGG